MIERQSTKLRQLLRAKTFLHMPSVYNVIGARLVQSLGFEAVYIGGYVTGAPFGFLYIRDEYPVAVDRVRKAIVKARERGLLGIFWSFPAILLFHFVLERRVANLLNVVFVVVVGIVLVGQITDGVVSAKRRAATAPFCRPNAITLWRQNGRSAI